LASARRFTQNDRNKTVTFSRREIILPVCGKRRRNKTGTWRLTILSSVFAAGTSRVGRIESDEKRARKPAVVCGKPEHDAGLARTGACWHIRSHADVTDE